MPFFAQKLSRLWRCLRESWRSVWEQPYFDSTGFDYDQYWLERRKKAEGLKVRYQIIARAVVKGASVLDLGCGDGALLNYIRTEQGASIQGVDISVQAADLAGRRGVPVKVDDISRPDFEIGGIYDYIVLSEVLEHLARPEDILAKVRGHFRHALFISVPNSGYLWDRIRLLFGRFPRQWAFHPAEHLRFWTVRDFIVWSQVLGFHVVNYCGTSGFPTLWRLWPKLFARQVLYILEE